MHSTLDFAGHASDRDESDEAGEAELHFLHLVFQLRDPLGHWQFHLF